MTELYGAFLAAIDDKPNDKTIWLQLADHLADLGEPEAEGWRWLVRRRKRPKYSDFSGRWFWWDAGGAALAGYRNDELPSNLSRHLKPPHSDNADFLRHYPTCSAALADAARAVVKWKRGVAAR
jgi:uncharacterized protein (TIGR02996 family)